MHDGWIAKADDLVRFAQHVHRFLPYQLLKPETVALMTRAPDGHAALHKFGKFIQTTTGGIPELPGTTSLLVRTNRRMCWAAGMNTGGSAGTLGSDLYRTIWTMTRHLLRR
jgi:hypothetical protein